MALFETQLTDNMCQLIPDRCWCFKQQVALLSSGSSKVLHQSCARPPQLIADSTLRRWPRSFPQTPHISLEYRDVGWMIGSGLPPAC